VPGQQTLTGLLTGQKVQKAGDQGGVRGALPGVAPEQLRRGKQQERQQRPVDLGEIQRSLDRASSGGGVAEGVARDGVQQEGPEPPSRGVS
jgi:hypothetical protein